MSFNKDLYLLDNEIKVLGDDLKFVFEDDNKKTYNVYIPKDDIKYFLDLSDEMELNLSDDCDESLRIGAKGVVENFLRGGSDYEVAIKEQKLIGYKFYRKEGGFHSVDKTKVGNPKTFLQQNPNYTYFESIMG
jgi:hypothetical protein